MDVSTLFSVGESSLKDFKDVWIVFGESNELEFSASQSSEGKSTSVAGAEVEMGKHGVELDLDFLCFWAISLASAEVIVFSLVIAIASDRASSGAAART